MDSSSSMNINKTSQNDVLSLDDAVGEGLRGKLMQIVNPRRFLMGFSIFFLGAFAFTKNDNVLRTDSNINARELIESLHLPLDAASNSQCDGYRNIPFAITNIAAKDIGNGKVRYGFHRDGYP